MSELPVVYSRFCFAWRTEDFLVLNEGLRGEGWGWLRDRIVAHELGHSGHGLSVRDVVLDFVDGFDPFFGWQCLKFAVRHPGSLLHLLPFFYRDDVLYVSWAHVILDVCFIIWAVLLLAFFVKGGVVAMFAFAVVSGLVGYGFVKKFGGVV